MSSISLPEGINEDGQHQWFPRLADVITIGDGKVYIDDPVCGDYPASRVREFALALLAAVEVSEAMA